MAKVINKVATVVAVLAAVASAIAMVTGHPEIAAALQLVAAAAGAVAAVSAFMMKPPAGPGSNSDWKADPQAGIPYVIGRTGVGGNIVHHASYGKDNKFAFFITVLSYGPIQQYEALLVDKATINFDGSGNAINGFPGIMWKRSQLGAVPEAAALVPANPGPWPGWDATSKLSGLAAEMWELKYDVKGDINFKNGIPSPLRVIKGVMVYDPRLDSTFPGGSGACRPLQESTYVYSENPWLHSLTWALGRWQQGKKVMGVGIPLAAILVSAYAEAATIADTNGWKCGGQIVSTDDKWDRLKAMAQAGGGTPIRHGALLSCLINAPRVSLDTVKRDDLAGDARIVGTQPRRMRVNGIVPRYRSEAHDWEVVAAAEVRVAAYVTADGGQRTKELDLTLVQDVNQATQLARYEVENSREGGPITLILKPKWIGYKPGDCITVDIPEIGLVAQTCIIRNREFDPATGSVTFELMTETAGKHSAAGVAGTAPPVTTTTPPSTLVDAPQAGSWSVAATSITSGGITSPALVVTGATDNANAEFVIFEYRIHGQSVWNVSGAPELPTATRKEILGVNPDTAYDVAVSYMARNARSNRLVISTGAGAVTSPPAYASSGEFDALGNIAYLDEIAFGTPYLVEDNASHTVAILSAFKTIAGTAAGILGQGALATVNAADFMTQVTGPGKPDAGSTVGDNWITNALLTVDTTGWRLPTSPASIVREATDIDRPAPAYFRNTAAGDTGFDQGQFTPILAVGTGNTAYLTAQFKGLAAGATANMAINFYNSNSGFAGYTQLNWTAIGTGWEGAGVRVPVPPGASQFYCSVTLGAGVKFAIPRLSWSQPGATAGTQMQLQQLGAGTSVIAGNAVTRNNPGNNVWNQLHLSKEFMTGTAFVSGKISAPDAAFGLSDSATIAGANANQTYYELDYCFLWSSAGAVFIFESGASIAQVTPGNAGNQYLITYDGVNVRYYIEGTLVRTTPTTKGRKFYAGVGVVTNNVTVSEIQFGAYTDNNLNSIGGDTITGIVGAGGGNLFGQITTINGTTFIGTAAIGTVMVADAAITDAKIGNTIQSASWNNTTKAGWKIDKNGLIQGQSIGLYDTTGTLIFGVNGTIGADRVTGNTGKNLIMNGDAESGSTFPWKITINNPGNCTLSVNTGSSFASGKYAFDMSKTADANYMAINNPAIAVLAGQKFTVKITIGAGGLGGTANGFYIRMLESNAEAAVGSDGFLISPTGSTDLVANGPIPPSPTTYTYTYTVPAGVRWVEPQLYNYINGSSRLRFDDFEMYEAINITSDITGKWDISNISTYIAAAAIDTALIKDAAITTALIKDAAILSAKIADAQIVAAKIGLLAVANANIINLTIGKGKIAIGELTVPQFANGADFTFAASGTEQTVMTSPVWTVGDGNDGKCHILIGGTFQNGTGSFDSGVQLDLYASINGGAYVKYATTKCGSRSDGGVSTYMYSPINISTSISASSTVQFQLRGTPILMPGAGGIRASTIAAPNMALFSGYR